jgi:hypothetical protein
VIRACAAAIAALGACGQPTERGVKPAGNAGAPATDAAVVDAAFDDADCTLERGAIAGQLRHGDAGVTTVVKPTFDAADRHLTEAVELADGTRVTFHIGGCAHYAWELTFEVPASAVGTDAERRLDAADALLRRAPMSDSLAVDMADKVRTRSRRTPRPAAGPWPIECGDASCAVDAVVEGSTLRIAVSYDFPL